MRIGLVTARIGIPAAQSLKDKRSVLRSLKDRVRQEINVSVAEVGEQDRWQTAELAFATVAATAEIVQGRIADIDRFLHRDPRYHLVDIRTELL
jgi:uncharacterized protein YlxP (DUF503 family)